MSAPPGGESEGQAFVLTYFGREGHQTFFLSDFRYPTLRTRAGFHPQAMVTLRRRVSDVRSATGTIQTDLIVRGL